MKNPNWYETVPLFFPADSEFCFISYFVAIEGGIYRTPDAKDPENGEFYEDIEVNQTKLIADFHDIEDWEQIGVDGVDGVFTIYWNTDTQILLVTDTEDAWETDCISLQGISKTEREEYLIGLADALIAGLRRTLIQDEAIKLQLPLFS